MKLTNVIKVWEILHHKDTGDIGFCDLEAAIDSVVKVENDVIPVVFKDSNISLCGDYRYYNYTNSFKVFYKDKVFIASFSFFNILLITAACNIHKAKR